MCHPCADRARPVTVRLANSNGSEDEEGQSEGAAPYSTTHPAGTNEVSGGGGAGDGNVVPSLKQLIS